MNDPPPHIPFIQRKDLWGHLVLKFKMTPAMQRALAHKLGDNVGLINPGGTIPRQYFDLVRDRVYHSIKHCWEVMDANKSSQRSWAYIYDLIFIERRSSWSSLVCLANHASERS